MANLDKRQIDRRRWAVWAHHLATALLALGALAILLGAALPWARFTLVGVPVALPGVTFVWGGIAAALGLGALSAPARRWPLAASVFGLVAVGVGAAAPSAVGRAVVARVLAVENGLTPVNARLAQVGLPAVEPFGGAIGPWREYVGAGPAWVAWGGAAVALGGAVRFAAGRSLRTCRACGALWRDGRSVAFCPVCGAADGEAPVLCPRCGAAPEAGDRFCARCGAGLTA